MKNELITFFLFTTVISSAFGGKQKEVVCHVPTWAPAEQLKAINNSHCSMYVIAYGDVDVEGNVYHTQLNGLESLKTPNNKVLLSFGGYAAGSRMFNEFGKSRQLRITFARNVLQFLRMNNFDGVDIDWEFPSNSDEVMNFARLLQELRDTVGPEYMVTAEVHPSPERYMDYMKEIMKPVDYLFVMTYDYHGGWDVSQTGKSFLAPLYAEDGLSISDSMNNWITAGAKSENLLCGIPFYGLKCKSKGQNQKPGSEASSCEVVAYNKVCPAFLGGWTAGFDENAQTYYLYQGHEWISMEDPESIRAKAKIVNELGLAGVFAWSLNFDDHDGNCLSCAWPLTRALGAALGYGDGCPTPPPVPKPDEKHEFDGVGRIRKCKSAGLFSNPKTCAKFNSCVGEGSGAFLMDCAPGTLWNIDEGRCGRNCKQ